MDCQVSWKNELEDLVATAKTDEERAALNAFQKSLGPYLDNPNLLRTLLGKIASFVGEIGIVPSQDQFKDIEDLKKALPGGVNVIKL